MECVPFEAAAIETFPNRAAWDAAAADLVAAMLARWHLTVRGALVGGAAGAVLRVSTADGSPAVLKVAYPHAEATWEAVGLDAAGSDLAPTVIRQDAWTWSLLLDDVLPGTRLGEGLPAAEALAVGGDLRARLSARPTPSGLPRVGDAMLAYTREAELRMPGQRAALDSLGVRVLLERALEQLAILADSPAGDSIVHGDFNPGNILLAGRGPAERWLLVDPKPMRGDAAFDLWPLVTQLGSPLAGPQPERVLAAHLDLAARAAGCDAERAARWAFARTGINVSWQLAAGSVQVEAETRALSAWNAVLAA